MRYFHPGDILETDTDSSISVWSSADSMDHLPRGRRSGFIEHDDVCIVVCCTEKDVLVFTNRMILGWVFKPCLRKLA